MNAGQLQDSDDEKTSNEANDVSPSAASDIQTKQTETRQQSQKISAKQTQKSGIAALVQFISEALVELKKIHWPDRQQVIKETLSVIVLVAIITACVLAFDYGIAKVVFEPLDKLARHLGGGIGVHH